MRKALSQPVSSRQAHSRACCALRPDNGLSGLPMCSHNVTPSTLEKFIAGMAPGAQRGLDPTTFPFSWFQGCPRGT